MKMNIKKCYDMLCDTEKLSCFVDCNNMFVNVLFLKELHDKLNQNVALGEDALIQFHNLRQEFQNKFVNICISLENGFDALIAGNNRINVS